MSPTVITIICAVMLMVATPIIVVRNGSDFRKASGLRKLDVAMKILEESVVFSGLSLGVIGTVLDILGRSLDSLGFSLLSTASGGEFTNFTIIWAVMLGAAAGTREGIHIGVAVVVKRLPPLIAKDIVIIGLIISAFFTAFIAYYGWQLVLFSFASGQVTMELFFPRWPLYLSVPVGMALITIHLLQNAYELAQLPAIEVRDSLEAESHS